MIHTILTSSLNVRNDCDLSALYNSTVLCNFVNSTKQTCMPAEKLYSHKTTVQEQFEQTMMSSCADYY